MALPEIKIGSTFDAKGFKKADTALGALGKSALKLTGTFITLQKAQQAMFNYMADEKGTKVLAQNLKNLGLAYATTEAETFIATLQEQTGVLDDELRPAYAQLARVTGTTLETQRLMNLAFNVAAGTGKDYTSVVDALSQAYVGNTKGLKSLNIGLTQADLKAKSFEEIVQILNDQFAGSGQASLESYAGQMALLQVATSNASEAIGKSLLDALSTVSGEGGFGSFLSSIKTSVQWLTDLITGVSRTIALLGVVASTRTIGGKITEIRRLNAKWDKDDIQVQKERLGIAANYTSYQAKQAAQNLASAKYSEIQKKNAAAQLAAQKKLTAEKKAQAALDKANLKLGQAENVFDLERISVNAAQQNATLTENERKRLEIKQAIFNLEDAIASKDTAKIVAATNLLNGLLGQFAVMQQQAGLLEKIKANFDALGINKELIDLNNLNEALRLIAEMQAKLATLGATKVGTTSVTAAGTTSGTGTNVTTVYTSNQGSPIGQGTYLNPTLYGANPTLAPTSLATGSYLSGNYYSMPNAPTGISSGTYLNPPPVNITIDGSVQDLIKVVVDGLQNQDASGISTRVLRNTGGLNW